jgi:hypothetical protein
VAKFGFAFGTLDAGAPFLDTLNICPDSSFATGTGLCTTTGSLFTSTNELKEGGKVLIHTTTKAGGSFTGASSLYLSKACLTNMAASSGTSVPVPTTVTHANL